MVERESDGSKGGEGKVESHRQGQSCSSAGLVSSEGSIGGAKLRLIGVVGGTGASCTINVCGGSDDLHAAVLSEGREGFRSRQRGPRSGSTLWTSLLLVAYDVGAHEAFRATATAVARRHWWSLRRDHLDGSIRASAL